ncbi:Cell wall assembly regulator SMI1 [Myroides marinus]|uniref:Cell wall assembly regulator SMI1 n=1 Tax=Myroides marinus TaxID=703342 RepID=A0A1H6UBV3_9FLAO|nr:SMI1/KNR4 family protein [Myroides marinus]SEI89819.1 Cell wall assembly regulator SMI1 [Myroides marinus]
MMKTIAESIQVIIEKQNELGYYMPKIINQPATDIQIKETEDKLGLKFNEELRELYAIANGVANDNITFSGLIGLIPIHVFMSLDDAIVYYNIGIDDTDYFENWENKFTPQKRLFPFLEDGAGNCYWVDLNPGTANENQIYWTNTFGEAPNYLYESLTNFLSTIAEGYETGVFMLDEENYLDMDYDRFDAISAKNNPYLDYWK